MKIQKIACPSCGFSFEIKELKNSGVHQCPSCKASLYLEEDKAPVVNININHYGSDSSEPILSTTKKTTGVMGLAILALSILLIQLLFLIKQLIPIVQCQTANLL